MGMIVWEFWGCGFENFSLRFLGNSRMIFDDFR